jgi:hypothetical protein
MGDMFARMIARRPRVLYRKQHVCSSHAVLNSPLWVLLASEILFLFASRATGGGGGLFWIWMPENPVYTSEHFQVRPYNTALSVMVYDAQPVPFSEQSQREPMNTVRIVSMNVRRLWVPISVFHLEINRVQLPLCTTIFSWFLRFALFSKRAPGERERDR